MDEKDLAKIPYVKLRAGKLYFHKRVPKHLVEIFKKPEIVEALGTADRKVAIKLRDIKMVEWQRKFDAAEASLRNDQKVEPLQLDNLTSAEMKLHVAQWLEMAKSDARSGFFVTPQEWGNSEQSQAEIVQELQDELALAENGVDAARKHLSEKTATDIAEYAGIAVSVTYTHPIQIRQAKVTANYSGKNYREFVELSRKALCELIRFNLNLYQAGGSPFTPTYKEVSTIPTLAKRVGSLEKPQTLQQLITVFNADPNNANMPRELRYKYDPLFRLMTEILGDDFRLDELSREHCKKVRDIITELPAHLLKKTDKSSLRKFLDDKTAYSNLKRQSITTQNDYIGRMGTFLKYALQAEYIDRNYADGLKIKDRAKKSKARHPFSLEQLKLIFSQPEFNRNGEFRIRRPVRYWVPIIAAYHGMRLSEICQG